MPDNTIRGRFAPSPSGRLHLGNVLTFLLAWLDVRARGGTMVFRLEDLDPERSWEHYANLMADDLLWLGLRLGLELVVGVEPRAVVPIVLHEAEVDRHLAHRAGHALSPPLCGGSTDAKRARDPRSHPAELRE